MRKRITLLLQQLKVHSIIESRKAGRALLFLLVLSLASFVSGAKLTRTHRVTLDEGVLFKAPSGIAVYKNKVLVSDISRCILFAFSLDSGRLLTEFGREGIGPNEFTMPNIRDMADGVIAVTNLGISKNYFYSFNDKSNKFSFHHRNNSGGTVVDLKILGRGEYLVNTLSDVNKRDGRAYVMTKLSDKGEKQYLLDIDKSFGEKTHVFGGNGPNDLTILSLPRYNVCCFNTNYFMYHWAGNLNPVIFDRTHNKRVDIKLKPSNKYRKPQNYRDIERAMQKRDMDLYWQEMGKYSWVVFNFLADRTIGVVYANYSAKRDVWLFQVALFSLSGELLCENELRGIEEAGRLDWPGVYFFQRAEKKLYGLSHEMGEDNEDRYSIISYQVSE